MKNLMDRMLDFARTQKNLYLYGTGYLGILTYAVLEQHGITVNGFLHSDHYPVFVNSMPAGCIAIPVSDLPNTDAGIIVTTFPKHYMDVSKHIENLKENRTGKLGIFCPNYSNNFLNTDNIDFQEFSENIIECIFTNKILLDQKQEYFTVNNMILPDFLNRQFYKLDTHSRYAFCAEIFDIVMGNYYEEGPYEYDKIFVKSNDVVFDFGANFGVFSAFAASKGSEVFAFEPMPENIPLLQKTVTNYSNIKIVEAAVSDISGEVKFELGRSTSSHIASVNGEISENQGDFIMVPSITLDDFVEKNHISRVDFIKADIEGAERNMLMGARNVLKKFAPKLSLCTYHLKDDRKVLTDLILEANPDYKIIYRWKKLYAYVPEN